MLLINISMFLISGSETYAFVTFSCKLMNNVTDLSVNGGDGSNLATKTPTNVGEHHRSASGSANMH